MPRKLLLSLALLAAMPAAAQAANAVAVTDVNLRAGPSTAYPVVDVVYAGEDVTIYGCLSNRSWCDVSFNGYRGWMSSNYLASTYSGERYVGPEVVEVVQVPTISFSVGGYWDRYYRDRPFYRDRDRYGGDRFDRDWDREENRRREIGSRRDRGDRQDWRRDRDRDIGDDALRPEYPGNGDIEVRRLGRGEVFEPEIRDY